MKNVLIPIAVGVAASFVADQVWNSVSTSPDQTSFQAKHATGVSYLAAGLVVLVAHHFTKAA